MAVAAGSAVTLDAADVSSGGNPAAAVAEVTPPAAPTAVVPATAAGPAPPGAVTLAFAGDVHFAHGLGTRLRTDPASVFAGMAPVLASADLAVVNLETAITERGRPERKEFTFRAPATAFDALAAAGVDVVSMANNHAVDYGPEGLRDSLIAASDAPVAVVGLGTDAPRAFEPYRATVRGRRIAVVAATQVLDRRYAGSWTATDTSAGVASAIDPTRLVNAVRAARATSDTVVVFMHWGIERQTCPTDAQRRLADQLVAAGADVVVGTHAHRLQGAGRLGGALVAYGLGNFAFATRPGPGTTSGVLVMDVDGRSVLSYRWVPATIVNGVPRFETGARADHASAAWARLRSCTGLAP